jgi:hypothetical protein
MNPFDKPMSSFHNCGFNFCLLLPAARVVFLNCSFYNLKNTGVIFGDIACGRPAIVMPHRPGYEHRIGARANQDPRKSLRFPLKSRSTHCLLLLQELQNFANVSAV